MKVRNGVLIAIVMLFTLPFSLPAFAGWDWSILTPAGWAASEGYGVSGVQQAGTVERLHSLGYLNDRQPHAALWSGTSSSFVDLNPAGCDFSEVCALSGSQQVGEAEYHAALWSGTSSSFVDLNPAGCDFSEAYGISGGQQVGWADYHAALWSGTSSSFLDLNPLGSRWSVAYGVSGGQQVGYAANNSGGSHAALWNGTSSSFEDLNPAGCFDSTAYAISDGQQVGYAYTAFGRHAALWSGTSSSFVDLNPVGCDNSTAWGVSDGQQVGQANYHAALWSGSADSYFDLGSLLPSSYRISSARGIERVGDQIWVVGYASDSFSDNNAAVLWHYTPVPEPSSLVLLGCGLFGLGGMIRRRRK